MYFINMVFGKGEDLNALQMSMRGIAIFLIALLLIRLAGRRSFGIRTPLDNIITISLGAVLSRAIVGASDFFAVVATCLAIVLLHRLIGWLTVKHPKLGRIMEGDKILLFENGKFYRQHMKRGLVSEEDIMQGIRKAAETDDINRFEKIYLERNGEITVVEKK